MYIPTRYMLFSVTRKKLPNVYKYCPKMISLEKLKILTPLQKFPKNVRDLGKLFVAKGLKKLPKVKKSPDLVTLMLFKFYVGFKVILQTQTYRFDLQYIYVHSKVKRWTENKLKF